MNVTVNGKSEQVGADDTLTTFLHSRNLVAQRVVVELNGEIVARERFGTTRLGEGDRVEVVHFVGGG
jgi:sulfur carrier protein